MGIQLKAPSRAESSIDAMPSCHEPLSKPLKRNEQLVYDALRESGAPLKAYQLLDELQEAGLRAPMTIYRALESLIAKDRVRKIESLNAFIAIGVGCEPRAHVFLICRKCLKTREITLDERQVAEMFSPIRVSIDDVRIEAFGDCEDVCAR